MCSVALPGDECRESSEVATLSLGISKLEKNVNYSSKLAEENVLVNNKGNSTKFPQWSLVKIKALRCKRTKAFIDMY